MQVIFSDSFDYYSVTMSKSKTRPLLLIIVAVAIAGGIAIYMSRQGSAETGSPSAAGESAQSVSVPSPGGGRVRGAPDAPITLVEYGDYQCPTCGLYHPIIMELLNRYPGKFKLEYHHFPLIQTHSNAMAASLAAEAAGEQGKFWEMHDLIFEHQRNGAICSGRIRTPRRSSSNMLFSWDWTRTSSCSPCGPLPPGTGSLQT